MHRRWIWAVVWMILGGAAQAAVPNSLLLNEANTISGDKFLDEQNRNRSDPTLGRIEGNGQNWLEFLVVQGDELGAGAFANTLDLRGWKIEWSYDKNDPMTPNRYGSGTIEFTSDPLWAAVPKGTLVTFNEWKQAWYRNLNEDPGGHGGLSRMGGINGLGELKGEPFAAGADSLRDFSTNTQWNPLLNSGGANGDWTIHAWAGERNPDNSYKYFSFSGTVVDGDPQAPIPIGSSAGGLYALNNDNWQWTIKDAAGNVIQGPYGEALSNGAWSINSQEIFRLEAFPTGTNPTQATYLGAEIFDYQDGTSSAFGRTNLWSGGSITQDVAALRNWLVPGDVDLDGLVNGDDFVAWQRNLGATQASLTQGDLNGDGTVTAADLAVLRAAWPAAAAAIVAVPESASILLATIAITGMAALRRRAH
ncbi:MAG TPA: dockerin type I repeat-containing protein [Lacipirellulaceae bacterium]|nr:dockerin type I repeat-containing protein [Lacipirellulaceae bacterium]